MKHRASVQHVGGRFQQPVCLFQLQAEFFGGLSHLVIHMLCMLFTPTPVFEKWCNEKAMEGVEFWPWQMPFSRKRIEKTSP